MSNSQNESRAEALADNQGRGLRPAFTPLGIWAFSIGTSIGWGSFVITCSTYLQKSGVLGTAFGLLVGMAIILVVTFNLEAMIMKSPDAGGVYTFERRIAGKDLGFLAFWFVLLTYLAIFWANITSLPLFARFFLGNTFQFGFHYEVFGYRVWMGEALLSAVAVAIIGFLCAKSSRLPMRIVVVAALAFSISIAGVALLVLFLHDSTFSFNPLYTEGSSHIGQIVRIAAISPWAFIGFENVAHFSEEYAFPAKRIGGIMICSVVATTALYLLMTALCVSAYPPEYDSWLAYIQDMGNLEGIKAVPAFYVAQHYMGDAGVAIMMVALFGVILTSLIGNMLALSRVIFAAGREGDAPRQLSVLNAQGIPDRAILAVAVLSILVPFVGRTAIGWIVDVTTLCATLIYGFISHAVFLSARQEGDRTQQITGVVGMALMAILLLLLLIPGLLPFDAMATESYFLFIVWSLLGLAYFRQIVKREQSQGREKGVVVWAVLLMLLVFASMMWVSRATEKEADEAVERIFLYHETHPGFDSEEDETAAREEYLKEQAKKISNTNILYSLVSLGLMMLSMVVLMDSFKENKQLGQRLSDAEREAQAAREIAELKESINSLLDNMPLITFSKDAQNGTYLACNQRFAEYANKQSPEEVVGLTDFDLFSPEVAAYFTGVDQRALEMDTPLVLDEDVLDALGNERHLQTTKFKFIDPSGRLCMLGMSTDVTEMEQIRRESERRQVAYQNAVTTSEIFQSIIDSLADDYFNLFYVDLETDDYIEYGSRTGVGHRFEEHRGTDFFKSSQRIAPEFIYEADQRAFVLALDKDRMLGEIRSHGTFIMQYRLMIDGTPTFVNLKATLINGNERYMIIGVNNIDAQVRERVAAQKTREERRAYARISALSGNMVVLYFVDPDSGHYTEFSSSSAYQALGLSKEGTDFFSCMRENGRGVVHPDDQDMFFAQVTKENILRTIKRDNVFTFDYRLEGPGLPTHVRFKAAETVEDDKTVLVVSVLDEDARVRREQEYARNLSQAQMRATRDQLTGVKNKHAYADAEDDLAEVIAATPDVEFAIVVCDINDLKKVNDTQGHKAGDEYIKRACMTICNVFKRSPVFRIGGDEFCVISRGHDYERLEEHMRMMDELNAKASQAGGVRIACGAAVYEEGLTVDDVFERADHRMYEYKMKMKAAEGNDGC